MKMKRCCFAGHKDVGSKFNTNNMKNKIIELIENESVREFWVGNYGSFDAYSSAVIRELKEIYKDIKLELVIPYLTKSIMEYKEEYYNKYDNILLANIPEKTPKQYRIIKANEYMVNNSDYLICYINHSWGGAAKTLEFANKKKHIQVINLGIYGK